MHSQKKFICELPVYANHDLIVKETPKKIMIETPNQSPLMDFTIEKITLVGLRPIAFPP
jgi:hypothetical protein